MIKKKLLSTSKYEVLKQMFSLREGALLSAMERILQKYYPAQDVFSHPEYIYATGDLPVLLVAHLDTVHPAPPRHFFHDSENHIIWTPDGLGADDRAGVFSIYEILRIGYRPSILFTTKEEVGGHGAYAFINDWSFPHVETNFIIELDRQGHTDAVYYDCGNPDFESFITRFGFQTEWGTFSDISIIGPHWDIAAVNLSIGYFNEHTRHEFLNYAYMFETIEKVKKILENCGDTGYPFMEVKYVFNSIPREVDGQIECDSCNCFYPEDSIIRARDKYNGDIWRLCPSCYSLNQDIVEVVQ